MKTTHIAAALAIACFMGMSGMGMSDAAQAADKITVARSGIDIAFAPIEVGEEAKIWEKNGIDLHVIDIPGTRIETVLTSGDAQVGLGAGIALSARLKGVPTIAVASIAGPPYNLTIIVPTQSPIKKATDLKGKIVAVSTAGSLTDWLVREVSRQEGWGSDGIKIAPLGDETSRMAALRSGGVDANVAALMQAFERQDQGQARIITYFGDVVKDFQSLVIKASDKVIADEPDLLKRFLKGWFESVAYMKAHKDVGTKVIAATWKIDPVAVDKAYDIEMKMMSDDGVFKTADMEDIRHSLVDMKVLEKMPEMHDLYTDRFVPVK